MHSGAIPASEKIQFSEVRNWRLETISVLSAHSSHTGSQKRSLSTRVGTPSWLMPDQHASPDKASFMLTSENAVVFPDP